VSQLSDDASPVGRNVRLMRLRRGETVRTQTPSLPFWQGDHLRRPHVALGLPPLTPARKPAAPLRVRRSSRMADRFFGSVL
jgi:hypothetical protein